MKRDFSEEKVTELWEFVESCTKDMISHTAGYLQNCGLEGDMLEAVIGLEAVDHFLEQMEEKEIITARKLEQIIADVREVDKTYGGYLKTLNDQLDAYDCKVRSVAEMLKPKKLSMKPANYLKEIQAISSAYSEAKENSEMLKVELWIKPGYRLSEEELKEAQEILDKYFVEGSLQQLMRDENCPVDGEKSIADWTVEEKLKYDKMMELYAKADIRISTFRGIYEGIPFMKQMEDGLSGWNAHIWGYDPGEGFECGNAFANSHTQHPYATLGGNIIGSLLTYHAAAGVARGIPGLSERISSLSGRLSTFPILRSIGQDHLTNIIGATFIDTGAFTIPRAIGDILEGKSAGNVFRNAGLDIGQNLLFNIGGEAISSAVGKVLKVGSGKSGSALIPDLSNKAVKHPMNDHMPARYAKQLQYMSKEAAEQYLSYKTFFNSNWTDEQVTAALNYGYKEALNSCVTTGKYSFKYLGENVTVFLEDGVFKTGYGDYIYTYDELLKLLGGK